MLAAHTSRLLARLVTQLLGGTATPLVLNYGTNETVALLDEAGMAAKQFDWSRHNQLVRSIFSGGDWELLSLFPVVSRAALRSPSHISEAFSRSSEGQMRGSFSRVFLHPVLIRYLSSIVQHNYRPLWLDDPRLPSPLISSHRSAPHYYVLPRLGAFFGHSCAPNLRLSSTPDHRCSYVSLRPISPGEPLTVSYVPTHDVPLALRRATLLHHFHILCRCERCMAEKPKSSPPSKSSS